MKPRGRLIKSGLRLLVEKVFSKTKSKKNTAIAGANLFEDISTKEGVKKKIINIRIASNLILFITNKVIK